MNSNPDLNAAKQWFKEAQFGMFIHWGLYAIPAGVWKGESISWFGEWIMHSAEIPMKEYELLAKEFNPTEFNARDWVRMAEDAGMRYMVFTAKHHDGFAMFHSPADKFNIVNATPFRRDPVAELADACRGTQVKLCLYYSQAQDWRDPHAGTGPYDGRYGNTWDFHCAGTSEGFDSYMSNKSLPQIRELLTQYGPIAMMWFDNPIVSFQKHHAEAVRELVRSLQPACLISNRIGHGLGDIGGYGDNVVPDDEAENVSEVCMTMNETWGYKHDGGQWKTGGEIVALKNTCGQRNCNLLLNVGPTAEGVFPEEAIDILRDIASE